MTGKMVSIIIPVKRSNAMLTECVEHCLRLDYPDFEIIVLSDGAESLGMGVRVIETGQVSPAVKRDRGAEAARGEILAFIDDDAYPRRDWLSKAVRHFDDSGVAAVGGPAVTPETDNRRQKASGRVLGSILGGGCTKSR
jgi:cellulose synthase/poly-beta-1,6-N-acetylglucosamine synthase-like glycosyltransferase